ncbi:putative O-glycosylation ligase, exosortase A system-associated [Ectothiorhodospira sp. BSL-9]|uniref:putative O-glycosylation ligase, exosortase A system-associated n=1 Tax=Ectothiorhodospira sp. BSL-9 TaxID=1442136 RepID=UPI0007B458D2|nr:putative O-glycosylation ligase, exosortase A system-associated [Ectothiorhodospira sp. BSL-9]ANB02210.1 polymerase [Ectothiorhodospira sp. BSL-9]
MRDLLLFAILLVLVVAIMRRPWIGVVAWFWVGLMLPHAHTWGFMRTFPMAVVIGGVTLIALVFAKDKRLPPMTREMVMMGLLVAWVTMTSFFAVSPDAWGQWDRFMRILVLVFVTPMLLFGQVKIAWVLVITVLSLGFYGFKGGLFAIQTGGQYHVLGPAGTFLGGNTYIGMAMLMVLPLMLVMARAFYHRWIDLGVPFLVRFYMPISWGFYATFWLTAIAILATHSRGAFVGVLVVAPLIFLHMQRKGLIVATALLLVLGVGVTAPDKLVDQWRTIVEYEQDASAMQRVQSWGAYWNMAVERPITGMGFRAHWMGYDWYAQYTNFDGGWGIAFSPHSIYFQMLGQHGFGGLAVYILLMVFTIMTLNRVRVVAKRRPGKMWLSESAWALQVGIIGFLVAGTFLDMAYFNLTYGLIALAIILRRELDENDGSVPIKATVDKGPNNGPSLRFPDFVVKS